MKSESIKFMHESNKVENEGEVLLKRGDKKLVLYHSIQNEIIDLFDEVCWGTGENQYQHKESKKRLELLEKPNLVKLMYKDELAAICLFINREVKSGNLTHNYFAVRYLFSVPRFRDKGLTARYAALTMMVMEKRQESPTIFVGVVEQKNIKSYRLVSSLGYEPYCTIKTVGFSRFFPKKNKSVKRISTPKERDQVRDKLNVFYANYSMVSFESLFKEPYYVYIKEGEIVAGVQAQKALWVVKNISGNLMKILFRITPFIPLLRKIFNPKKFEFLGFDCIFFEKGHENELLALFSHVLAVHNLNSGMFWADIRSNLYQNIEAKGSLGILNKFTEDADSEMLVKTKNIPEKEVEQLKKMWTYHSAFDFL